MQTGLTLYDGSWQKGVRQGFGFYRDENGASFSGVWKDDMRQGGFEVKKDNVRFTVSLQFDRDIWVVMRKTIDDVIKNYLAKVPESIWNKWKGIDIFYPAMGERPAGSYTGLMKMIMRHGHGTMHFEDGTVLIQNWVDDVPAKDGAQTGEDWFVLMTKLRKEVAAVQKGLGRVPKPTECINDTSSCADSGCCTNAGSVCFIKSERWTNCNEICKHTKKADAWMGDVWSCEIHKLPCQDAAGDPAKRLKCSIDFACEGKADSKCVDDKCSFYKNMVED
mmetsp:Transcript_67074/g.129724  ORF Transcript_67074/g.129724 Transcript_67074/m.129724 type:complete len:277 (-) Transcript_67074:14-844(-)